jgi:DNA-binding CsgD family transcriptional regulator
VAVWEGGVPVARAAALADLATLEALAAVDELVAADILRPGDPVEFAHPLVRAAVYGALPSAERARLHRRAAGQLTAERAPVEQVAVHLLHTPPAGDVDVVASLRAAAAHAIGAGVPRSAVDYLARASAELAPAPHDRELVAELGRAEWLAGRPEALVHLRSAVASSQGTVERARRSLELGRALHDFADPAGACEVLAAARTELSARTGLSVRTGLAERHDRPAQVEVADPPDREDPAELVDPADLVDLALDIESAYLTSAVTVPERAEDAHRRADAIIADPDGLGSAAGRTLASKALSMRTYDGGNRDQLVELARTLRSFDGLVSEEGMASQALGHVVIALSFCDEYRAASELLDAARRFVHERGWVILQAAYATLAARQRVWTGPLSQAVAEARDAVEIFAGGRQLYLPSVTAVAVRAHLELDEPDDAAAVIEVMARQPPPRGMFTAWHHESVGRLAAHRGDDEAALRACLAWGEVANGGRVTNPGLFAWRSQAGLAALRLGDRALAGELIAEEVELAGRFGAPRAIAVARRAAAALQPDRDAVAVLEAAASMCRACGAHVEAAAALADLGAATRRAGRPSEARAVLRDAIELADRVDARHTARLARAELAVAGGRPPADRGSPGELTPAERRVAELAASGLTNRQIASQLYVTVKNVEWHLANTYRRLGISRRQELAAALDRDAATS